MTMIHQSEKIEFYENNSEPGPISFLLSNENNTLAKVCTLKHPWIAGYSLCLVLRGRVCY